MTKFAIRLIFELGRLQPQCRPSPAATKHDPDEIIARYGAAAGQRLINAAEQGPFVLGALITRHGIDCD